jgi:putative ABC transport system substrate-binding protein
MQRRDFVILVGGAAAWPFSARAQRPERVRRIGILFGGFSDDDPEPPTRVEAFRRHLQQLGWTEGRNLQIDLRIGAGDRERLREYAAELIGLMPDVLSANGGAALTALVRQTRTIPIVFANVFDPVEGGAVESLARPGGNVTGFSNFEPPMTGKWLELLKEIAPAVNRVAIMFDRGTYTRFRRAVEDLAPSFHLQCVPAPVTNAADIEHAIELIGREPGGSLIVMGTVAAAHREAIVRLAEEHRVPAAYPFGYYVRLGGLVSYGVDGVDPWRRAAPYVDRILRGAKPADLPVQAPTKFELVINLKAAKALGLTVPATLLATADELIE